MRELEDMNEAILDPKGRLVPAHLKNGKAVTVTFGPKNKPHLQYETPWALGGTFAQVYKFEVSPGVFKALRVFKTDVRPETRDRYVALGAYLNRHASDYTVEFTYHQDGISDRDGTVHPILEMEWIEGHTLLEEVEARCKANDKAGLEGLASQWLELLSAMDEKGIAHGCLCGDQSF